MIDLKTHIRHVPDFPKPGILFYDIGTLLANGPAWRETVERLAAIIAPLQPDRLAGIESRGFLTGAAVAARLGIGFVMIRKPGKLPGTVAAKDYALEYGTDRIEIQDTVLQPGETVALCDDLLATGGTAAAAIALLRQQKVIVAQAVFVIELNFLQGRAKLDVPVTSLVQYDS